MPAIGILFKDYANYPMPKRVYCDSNFAFRLLNYEILNATPLKLHPLDKTCHSFYQQLRSDNVEIIASLFTYSELIHIYCFQYPKGMYELAASFLRTKTGSAPPNPHKCFKN